MNSSLSLLKYWKYGRKIYIIGFLATFLYAFVKILMLFYSGTIIDKVFGNLATLDTSITEIIYVITVFCFIILLLEKRRE